jgi:hypothetical protein
MTFDRPVPSWHPSGIKTAQPSRLLNLLRYRLIRKLERPELAPETRNRPCVAGEALIVHAVNAPRRIGFARPAIHVIQQMPLFSRNCLPTFHEGMITRAKSSVWSLLSVIT